MKYDVKDLKPANQGRDKIEWAEEQMPVLRLIRERQKGGGVGLGVRP